MDKFKKYAEDVLKRQNVDDEEYETFQAQRNLIEKVRKRLEKKVSEANDRLQTSSKQI
jgi:hypothetical protein